MIYFVLALGLSLGLTFLAKNLAARRGLIDLPDGGRKQHGRPTPLGGGLAIFTAFWVSVALLSLTGQLGQNLAPERLWGVLAGGAILMIFGWFDDQRGLSPSWRLLGGVLAAFLVILGGVGLDKITNPLGGVLRLDGWQVALGPLGQIAVIADLLVFFWLLGMTYTVKILDGLDGLAAGVTAIGALMIFLVANGERWHQPDVALVALVFAGACLGFLFFNFHPAKIFLGEGGGLWLGFTLGVLSVIAGGKIATALLVMAVPILDLIRVVYLRLKTGQPIFHGDRRHLHYRLLDIGFSHQQAVLALYAIAILFGLTTVFLQSFNKLIVLILLAALMLLFGFWLGEKDERGAAGKIN